MQRMVRRITVASGAPAPWRRIPLVVAAVCTLTAMSASLAWAAPGDLDPAFGTSGKVTTHFEGVGGAQAVALQADGKIVAVGGTGKPFRFALARYNPHGSLDTTFGGDGKVTTNFVKGYERAYGVAIQPDGKIVAVGQAFGTSFDSNFALARYLPDGTLDTTFGGNGMVTINLTKGDDGATGVAIQPDGKIVVVGTAASPCCPAPGRFALVRYMPNGTLDTTFGGDGKVRTAFVIGDAKNANATGVAIQADGKIVAVGTASCVAVCSRVALARYNTDGTLDTTFGDSGKVMTNLTDGFDEGFAVAIQADGKIVAAGRAGFCCEYTGSFGLVRYDTDGTLDTTFNGNGEVITDFTDGNDSAYGVAIQADGKVVAAGLVGYAGPESSTGFALARYNTDGTLDSAFGADGQVITDVTGELDGAHGVVIQANGKIVAAGMGGRWPDVRFALARYLGS